MNLMGIILPIAALLIAGLLVAALWLWWGGGESPTEGSNSSQDTVPIPPTIATEISPPPAGFHVLPSPTSGKVMIQIKEETYQHITEIQDIAIQNQIRSQIQALHQFTSTQQEQRISPPVPSAPIVPPNLVEQEIVVADTIAGQIETILQAHLLTIPQMVGRSIHILNAADGGVQIKVDDSYYDSVDDVQDAEIRTILQAAIREWELRSQLS